jgi:DNA-binding NarL/FixJ family response regulator
MVNSDKINTIIADSQYLTAESLKKIIESTHDCVFSGHVESYSDLNRILKSKIVELLIIDFGLIDYENLEDFRNVVSENPGIGILSITNNLSNNEIIELTKAGIKNIIYKSAGLEEIKLAINATIRKKKYFSGEVLDLLVKTTRARNEIHESGTLTQSEKEIVKLIADGLTTKEIAVKKHISFHTVTTHRKNIFRKLSVNNSSELLMHAVRGGLIDHIEYYI